MQDSSQVNGGNQRTMMTVETKALALSANGSLTHRRMRTLSLMTACEGGDGLDNELEAMGTAASVGDNGGSNGGGGKISPEGTSGEMADENATQGADGGMKVSEEQTKDIAQIRTVIRKALGEAMATCRMKGIGADIEIEGDLGYGAQSVFATVKAPKTTTEEATASDVSLPANLVLPQQAVSDCIDCVQRLCTTGASIFAEFPGTLHVGAQRSFAIARATLLMNVKSTPRQLTTLRRPSLLKGFTLKQLNEAAVKETDADFIDQLRNGVNCTKHPRSGKPSARVLWLANDDIHICIGKKKTEKLKSVKGWALDEPTGFTVEKGVGSEIFSRTLPDATDEQKKCCLVAHLANRTFDLQFENQAMRDGLFDYLQRYIPKIKQELNIKFTAGQTNLGMDVGLGAKVAAVEKDGLADLNDVRVGDRILKVNGEDIATSLPPKKINSILKSETRKGDVVLNLGRYTESGETLSSSQEELISIISAMSHIMQHVIHALCAPPRKARLYEISVTGFHNACTLDSNICINFDGKHQYAIGDSAGNGQNDDSPHDDALGDLPFSGLDVLVSELISNTPADTTADESSHIKSKGCIMVHGVKLEVSILAQQPRLSSVEESGREASKIGDKEANTSSSPSIEIEAVSATKDTTSATNSQGLMPDSAKQPTAGSPSDTKEAAQVTSPAAEKTPEESAPVLNDGDKGSNEVTSA